MYSYDKKRDLDRKKAHVGITNAKLAKWKYSSLITLHKKVQNEYK